MKVKQILVGSCLLAIFMAACKPTLLPKEEKFGVSLLRYHVTEDGKKEGAWERLDSTGKILLEAAFYEADSLEGENKLFDLDGKIAELRHYKKGKLNGEFKSYYPNGQVNSDAVYVNDKYEGEYKRYFPNGKLRETVQFKNGVEDGAFKEFYSDGRPKAEGNYKYNSRFDSAQEDGALVEYDSATAKVTKKNCVMGRCTTVE
jgi:antitoxin component YwqK of YwqJK toxin-antitoxin module